jgi:hypothetical protein
MLSNSLSGFPEFLIKNQPWIAKSRCGAALVNGAADFLTLEQGDARFGILAAAAPGNLFTRWRCSWSKVTRVAISPPHFRDRCRGCLARFPRSVQLIAQGREPVPGIHAPHHFGGVCLQVPHTGSRMVCGAFHGEMVTGMTASRKC